METELTNKLKENQTIKDLLKSEVLCQQLNGLVEKKKEHDMFNLLNNYYGGKLSGLQKDDNILKDLILESEDFKKFIIELINVIEGDDKN